MIGLALTHMYMYHSWPSYSFWNRKLMLLYAQKSLAVLHDIYKWAASWENRIFAYAKTKTQISFAVTAKLISAFVFAIRIVQSLYFLNPKFQASSYLLWLHSPNCVGQASSYLLWLHSPNCVGPSRKPRRPVFSQRGSNNTKINRIYY